MPDLHFSATFDSITTNIGEVSRVAVTGGTGFIGRRLVGRLIAEGHSVRVLTRRIPANTDNLAPIEYFQSDLTSDLSNLEQFLYGVEVLYHCAAEINDSEKMNATNLGGTINLARAAKGTIRHWVQLSSVDVYGTHVDGVITEKTPVSPVNVYEESKAAADAAVIDAALKYDFSYAILRPSKVYGPEMQNRVLFQLISLIDRGLLCSIGRPGASANYIHVDDVVDALVRCGGSSAARNRTFNLSDYGTIEELVEIIARALNKHPPRLRIPEAWARIAARATKFIPRNPLTEQRVNAMVKRAKYPSAKIEAELGYRHSVSMEIGMEQLVRTWQEKKR